ncbi:MAG: ABC transporter ATP-binding protein [Candidatus Eisenbacteria bacterium]
MIWATVNSILHTIFDLAPPLLIGAAVDVVVKGKDSIIAHLGVTDTTMQLLVLAGLTLLIWGLESVFEYLYAVQWRNLAQTLQHELRLEGYAHVQQLDMAYFEDASTGGLMSVLNDDINQLERLLDGGANDLLQVSTTVVVIGAIFFYLAPTVALFAFVPIPLILWGSFRYQHRLEPRYAAVRQRVGILNGLLSNNLGGIATIKSFTAEAHEERRVSEESLRYCDANRQAIKLSSAFSPLIRMVIVVGFTMTLILGGRAVFAGTLEVGAYSVMVFLTQRLLWPLTRLGVTVDLYQRAMASTTRVLDLLATPIQVKSGDSRLAIETRDGSAVQAVPPPTPVQGAIRFDHVDFAYGNGVPVLRQLDLDVPAGKTIAIVGPTGSGKSSIVKLILRFYEPQSGRILLDGIDLREIRLTDLRRAIGLVSQDVFLFHGTVRQNITYGTFDATEEEIVAAARAAEAHAFIMALPQGYDTVVGERGQKLSGGQRQRISIARAVLKDPPILVLDEATSAVDNETEAAIQRSLARISVGRTTVLIAHRLSTIRHAHRIYLLDDGIIRERGTHEELLEVGGLYAALWRVQTGESRPEELEEVSRGR